MPAPEGPPGEGRAEQEAQPSFQAARFPSEQAAGRASVRAQETIYQAPCDLSASRFHLDRLWRVAVTGQQPPAQLHARLVAILAAGEPAQLPGEVAQMLEVRRRQMRRRGPWSEGHDRSGKRL